MLFKHKVYIRSRNKDINIYNEMSDFLDVTISMTFLFENKVFKKNYRRKFTFISFLTFHTKSILNISGT